MVPGAGASGTVGEFKMVPRAGAVSAEEEALWWWLGEADGDVGIWTFVSGGMLGTAGSWW